MKTIVIAGGNGFIARHLIRRLDRNRYHIIALVRTIKNIELVDDVEYVELSFSEYDTIGRYIQKCDIFIPLAWDGAKRSDLRDEGKNRSSYATLLKTARYLIDCCGCKKIILPGSYYEYCNHGKPIDEEADESPALAYGQYKLRLYRELRDYCVSRAVTCVEFRMFSIYGADDVPDKMINSTLRKLLDGETVILEHGKQLYSFLYIEDAVDAFLKAVETDGEITGHYNLSSNCHMQLWAFVDLMRELAGSTSKIICRDEMVPASESIHTIMLSEKLSKVIRWRPDTQFETGVRRMLEYTQGEKEYDI